MYKYFIFYFSLSLFLACTSVSSKTQKLEDAKWNAVMANHDVVMPMMGTTNKVRKNLKNFMTSQENLPAEMTTKINDLITQLDKADEGMMDWMNGFQQLEKLQATKEHKEIMTYLEEQDVIIKQVGIDMTNSIKSGTDFLKGFEAQ